MRRRKKRREAGRDADTCEAKFSKKRLLKIAIRFYKTLLYTANFERYHKCYFCPLPGCPSTRAIKKLSNHLVQVHRIHDRRERAKVLKQAKDIGPQAPQRRKVNITINEAFSRVRQRSSYLVEPKSKSGKGKQKAVSSTGMLKKLPNLPVTIVCLLQSRCQRSPITGAVVRTTTSKIS